MGLCGAPEPASAGHVVNNAWNGRSREFLIQNPEVLRAGFSKDIRNGALAGRVNCSEAYRL